jgi:hypothetical protein
MVTTGSLDYLMDRGQRPLLTECDTSKFGARRDAGIVIKGTSMTSEQTSVLVAVPALRHLSNCDEIHDQHER